MQLRRKAFLRRGTAVGTVRKLAYLPSLVLISGGIHPVIQNATYSQVVPEVSVVVINYNTGYLLDRMFAALDAATTSLRIEIIVVDKASTDNSVEILESRYPSVKLIKNPTNVGFGRANNQCIPYIRGRYVLLLNTDAFVPSDTLENTVRFMTTHPQSGLLVVKLIAS